MLAKMLAFLHWKRHTVSANLLFCGLGSPHLLYPKILAAIARELSVFLFNQTPQQRIAPQAEQLLPELRRGGLLLTAHYGNWERMGSWMLSLGIPLVASSLPMKNALADAVLIRLRRRNGDYAKNLFQNPFQIRKLIADGHLFTLLADQDYRNRHAVRSRFFGKSVNCSPLPKVIQHLFPECPAFFAWTWRDSSGTLVLECKKLTGDLYAAYHQAIEDVIRLDPSQWIGATHRRFYSTSPKIY